MFKWAVPKVNAGRPFVNAGLPGKPPKQRHLSEEKKVALSFPRRALCWKQKRWEPSGQLIRYRSFSKKRRTEGIRSPVDAVRTWTWYFICFAGATSKKRLKGAMMAGR